MTSRMTVADRLTLIVLPLAAIAALAGLLLPGLYRDTEDGIRQARATDLVTLVLAVPVLGLGLWRARAGSAAARLVGTATLGYLAYSYAIYAFSVVINPMTPVHIAVFGLATWGLALTAFRLDAAVVDLTSAFTFPRRTTGVFLVGVADLFALLWLSQIAGAIATGRLPMAVSDLALPTSPVYTLDLAFAVPLIALAGTWLIRQNRRGPAIAAAALAFLVILGTSVLSIFAFEAAAGIAVELPPIVIFGAVTATAAVLLAVGLTGAARRAPTLSSAPA